MPAQASAPNGPRPPALVPSARASTTDVAGVIKQAATSTGANFEYLLATAKVESNLNPTLTVRTSTATGLFQFLEQTWLGAMKTAGRAFGFDRFADAISQSASGHYTVDDPALRDQMMKLRQDPAANAIMAGVVTKQNTAVLAARIGREPTEGELYVAHFFGPYAGSRVIQLAASNPNANAAALFPAAASANKPIFYDRQGNARTVAGVHDELIRRYQLAKARPTPGVAPAAVALAGVPKFPLTQPTGLAPVGAPARARQVNTLVPDTAAVTSSIATARAGLSRKPDALQTESSNMPAAHRAPSAFHSLFETDERRGPVSPVVAELWGAPTTRPVTPVADAAQPPRSPAAEAGPLGLFQESRPAVRALFKGGA